ncbi:PepSY domain-containing protein [Devosia sp. 2618]|uniref:PepSY domain-containing protein n=1 Tax=Devosia sp. 2618 TaxID=3156454 RepID=UPI003392FF19
MKPLTIAALLAVASLTAMPSIAMADTIHGRSESAIEASLRGQGLDVISVEQWGQNIRVYVAAEDGKTAMQLVDARTLQPISW